MTKSLHSDNSTKHKGMEEQNFNPAIEAVVSIRHFAMAASNNWNSIKSLGSRLKSDIETIAIMIDKYGSNGTKQKWKAEHENYEKELRHLQEIMSHTISKIKGKSAGNLSEEWNKYPNHVKKIEQSYKLLKSMGDESLPGNERENWGKLWNNLWDTHQKIKNEAEASSLQLKLIEDHAPEEINDLTHTILKHIPFKYSIEEAHQYTDEYMKAYKEIKKEASAKKGLWDRFLDLLAGGIEQTPAQRVMMQRWVHGEKGDLH